MPIKVVLLIHLFYKAAW